MPLFSIFDFHRGSTHLLLELVDGSGAVALAEFAAVLAEDQRGVGVLGHAELERLQDEPLPQRPPSARLLRRSEAPAAGGSALAAARALAPPVQPSMVLQGGLAAALPRERVPLRPGAAGSKVSASLLREDVRPGMRQPSRP